MKKILVLFMVFSLLLTSAFAGGSSESTASDAAKEVTAEDLAGITLEFWHAQTGENGVAMDKVVALFNETNEYGITVNATCQGGYNDCHNKVLSALSAGTAPNISQAYNNNMMRRNSHRWCQATLRKTRHSPTEEHMQPVWERALR